MAPCDRFVIHWGDLPKWFATIHRTLETPANSIVFLAVLAAAMAVTGSFVFLAVVSVLSRLFVYAVTIAALPRAPQQRLITPFHWASGVIGIAVCIWAAAQADAKAWLTLGALAVAGLALFGASRLSVSRS